MTCAAPHDAMRATLKPPRDASLVVELFTEELPPKALKAPRRMRSPTAVASGLRTRGFLDEATRPSRRTRRHGASPSSITHVRAASRPTAESRRQADAGRGRARRERASRRRRWRRSSQARSRHLATASLDAVDGADRIYVSPTARPTTSICASLAKGRAAARRTRRSARRRARQAADPEGDELRRRRRLLQRRRSSSGLRIGSLALHGADVVPGDGARPRCRAHHGGPPLPRSRATSRSQRADAYAPTLEAEGKVMPRASRAAARQIVARSCERVAGAPR